MVQYASMGRVEDRPSAVKDTSVFIGISNEPAASGTPSPIIYTVGGKVPEVLSLEISTSPVPSSTYSTPWASSSSRHTTSVSMPGTTSSSVMGSGAKLDALMYTSREPFTTVLLMRSSMPVPGGSSKEYSVGGAPDIDITWRISLWVIT